MSQSKARWKTLILEGILIVFSILLAFSIDAWWDGQKVEQQRIELLQALRDDFVQTSIALESAVAEAQELEERTGGFLTAVRTDSSIPDDSLRLLFAGVGQAAIYDPSIPSYQVAVATGRIELVRSPRLIAALAGFDLAHSTYQLHLGVSASLFYLDAVQDLRRAGVSLDTPGADRLFFEVPDGFDMRGRLATSSAEPLYTVQRNIKENLEDMHSATVAILEELDILLS
jgi:hypothetical protein